MKLNSHSHLEPLSSVLVTLDWIGLNKQRFSLSNSTADRKRADQRAEKERKREEEREITLADLENKLKPLSYFFLHTAHTTAEDCYFKCHLA